MKDEQLPGVHTRLICLIYSPVKVEETQKGKPELSEASEIRKKSSI